VGLAIAVSLTLWRSQDAGVTLQPPLPQDPNIQVYFNQAQSAAYTDPYRQRQRLGDDLEAVIVEAIAAAQVSVDVAVQELTLPRIAQALRDKYQSGVPVRVVLENQYSTSWSQVSPQDVAALDERQQNDYTEFKQFVDVNGDRQLSQDELLTRDALSILQAGGVPVIDDTADGSKGSDLMHHKVVIIDNTIVLVGSVNFTMSGVHGDYGSATSLGNANHLLKITSPALAAMFSEEFALLWGDGPGGQTDSLFGLQKPHRPPQQVALSPTSSITVQFSPASPSRHTWEESANGLIGRTLSRSTQTIDMALFVFSDQTLSHALQRQQQAGTQIRALIEPGLAYRSYSETLDIMGVALPNSRCNYDEGNRPWMRPLTTVGVPQLPDGDVLHHKFGVIDHHLVITGSQNWSAAANNSNDENVLVIDNATVAAHFEREFERLYGAASLGVPSWLQDKMTDQQAKCVSS
jgi:phosphatidylserine/phosphatidylglycerophosphate/cardiolipin synthase-like enzyme